MSTILGPDWEITVLIHVTPTDDLVEHTLTPDCVCLPEKTFDKTDAGTPVTEYAHHALDNREIGTSDE